MYRTILILFITVLLLPTTSLALKEWTVCVYCCAEDAKSSGIEEAIVQATREVADLGTDADVGFCVQVDSGKWTNDYIQSFYPDGGDVGASRISISGHEMFLEDNLGEVNMGDPYALWSFLQWVARKHTARNYLLVFSGHGSGVFSWSGTGGTNSYNPGQVNFDPDNFVCYDQNDTLTVFEIKAVLAAFRDKLNRGRPITAVAYDSCLAGSLEALYELRKVSHYTVASPTTIPITGLDYYAPVLALRRNPRLHPEKLCEVVVKAFVDKSSNGNVMAAWRMSDIEELAGAVDRLGFELLRGVKQTGAGFGISGGLFKYYDGDYYWDSRKLFSSIINGQTYFAKNNRRVPYEHYQAIYEAADYAKSCVNAARVSLWYSGEYADAKVGGLSIAWPKTDKYGNLRPFYQALAMSRELRWDNFLDYRIGIY